RGEEGPALVFADQPADRDSGGRLAGGPGVRPPLADRADVSLPQERVGVGEPALVDLGATAEAAAAGDAGVRVPAVAAGTALGGVAAWRVALFLPRHRAAGPGDRQPPVSAARGAQSALVGSSSPAGPRPTNSGMTHAPAIAPPPGPIRIPSLRTIV